MLSHLLSQQFSSHWRDENSWACRVVLTCKSCDLWMWSWDCTPFSVTGRPVFFCHSVFLVTAYERPCSFNFLVCPCERTKACNLNENHVVWVGRALPSFLELPFPKVPFGPTSDVWGNSYCESYVLALHVLPNLCITGASNPWIYGNYA